MEFISFKTLISISSTLIDFLFKQTVYASLLFVLIFIISFILRKKSPVWRYGLWAIFFIRLVVPVDLHLPFSLEIPLHQIPVVDIINKSLNGITESAEIEKFNRNNPVSDSSSPVANKNKEMKNYNDDANNIKWLYTVLSLWTTGFILITLLIIRKYFWFNKIIKNSTLIKNDKILSFLSDNKDLLNIKRKIKIICSDRFPSPFTKGFLRPSIFIPESLLLSADIGILNSVIAHELTHIKYNDALWIRFQNVMQIIFFFNPLIWIACRQMNIAREQLCDLSVLSKSLISKKTYGNSILYLLKNNLSGTNLVELMPCFGDYNRMIKQRIENIIRSKEMKKYMIIPSAVIICILGVLTILFFNDSGKKNNIQNTEVETVIKYYSEDGEEIDREIADDYSSKSHTISRSEIQQKVLNNLNNALKGLRAGPYRINGKIEGYKLFRVSPTNILYKLGARSGDLAKRINGHVIDSTEKILGLWQSAQGKSKITVDLERYGIVRKVTLDIID